MKKILLGSFGLLFTGMLVAQSIPDGNFETWNTTTWQDPTYYMSSNDQLVPQGVAANATQTTGYLGVNYGVMLQTISTTGGTQAGYIINGNPNNSGISGGIPYAQKPTGVRFYYKYTPVNNDTAAVLVIFKLLGSPIDSFLVALPTAESSYTLHSYYPTHSLPATPDTVVFGAVSSLAAITNGGGTPGSTLVIDSVTFTGVSSQPADMNGDFELWNTDTVLSLPQWYLGYPNATQTTDAYAGHYALELKTENTTQNGIQVGQASTGYYPQNCNTNCNEEGGQPYTLTGTGKDTLYVEYKYLPETNDTANISLDFIKNGQSVWYAGNSFFGTTSTYTKGSIPFDLSGASPVPDTVIVNITSSAHNHDTTNAQNAPYVGTVLKIDNMYFASQKSADLGINNIAVAEGIHVFPNPVNSQVNVDLTNVSGSLEALAIYDMSGRMLNRQSYSGGARNTLETIDMSGLSAGMYLIEATTSNGKFYQKVCKN